MSDFNPCTDYCPGGNCPGCLNGSVWCQDPRCQPYCSTCGINPSTDFNGTMVVIIILLCLASMLFIIWFVYGPKYFSTHDDIPITIPS